jgi:hypothetical protein
MRKGAGALRADGFTGDVKILTSCPSCLQGLSRYDNDSATQADYIVVEMARTCSVRTGPALHRPGQQRRHRARAGLGHSAKDQ